MILFLLLVGLTLFSLYFYCFRLPRSTKQYNQTLLSAISVILMGLYLGYFLVRIYYYGENGFGDIINKYDINFFVSMFQYISSIFITFLIYLFAKNKYGTSGFKLSMKLVGIALFLVGCVAIYGILSGNLNGDGYFSSNNQYTMRAGTELLGLLWLSVYMLGGHEIGRLLFRRFFDTQAKEVDSI